MILIEYSSMLVKTLDCWKGKKVPCNQVRRRKRRKELGGDLGLWRELWERKSFCTLGSSLTNGEIWLRQTGSFRASEEKTSFSQFAAARTEEELPGDSESYHPALSVWHMYAAAGGELGAGSWLRRSAWREDWGWLCRDRWSGWHPAWPCWGFMRR